MALLEARSIGKSFGALRALDAVDVTVAANSFHGLIGPNGSGKSTFLKALAGAHFPDQGRIAFDVLLDRLPGIALTPGRNDFRHEPSAILYGLEHLWVTFDPEAAEG